MAVGPEQYISAEEVAGMLRVHINTVYRLLRSGQIKGVRIGVLWRVDPDEVTRYLTRGN